MGSPGPAGRGGPLGGLPEWAAEDTTGVGERHQCVLDSPFHEAPPPQGPSCPAWPSSQRGKRARTRPGRASCRCPPRCGWLRPSGRGTHSVMPSSAGVGSSSRGMTIPALSRISSLRLLTKVPLRSKRALMKGILLRSGTPEAWSLLLRDLVAAEHDGRAVWHRDRGADPLDLDLGQFDGHRVRGAERRRALLDAADQVRDGRAQLQVDEAAVGRDDRADVEDHTVLDDLDDGVGDRGRLGDLDVEVGDVGDLVQDGQVRPVGVVHQQARGGDQLDALGLLARTARRMTSSSRSLRKVHWNDTPPEPRKSSVPSWLP